jgi:hypothetical protein
MVTDPEVRQSARGTYRMTLESSKYELMAFGRSHGPATRWANVFLQADVNTPYARGALDLMKNLEKTKEL